jgi:hypothetical protein
MVTWPEMLDKLEPYFPKNKDGYKMPDITMQTISLLGLTTYVGQVSGILLRKFDGLGSDKQERMEITAYLYYYLFYYYSTFTNEVMQRENIVGEDTPLIIIVNRLNDSLTRLRNVTNAVPTTITRADSLMYAKEVERGVHQLAHHWGLSLHMIQTKIFTLLNNKGVVPPDFSMALIREFDLYINDFFVLVAMYRYGRDSGTEWITKNSTLLKPYMDNYRINGKGITKAMRNMERVRVLKVNRGHYQITDKGYKLLKLQKIT